MQVACQKLFSEKKFGWCFICGELYDYA